MLAEHDHLLLRDEAFEILPRVLGVHDDIGASPNPIHAAFSARE